MIKLKNRNNKQTLEISQERPDKKINIDVIDNKGNVDYYFEIDPDELLTFLNDYQKANNII